MERYVDYERLGLGYIQSVIRWTDDCLEYFIQHDATFEMIGRKGGFLCIANTEGAPRLTCIIGDVHKKKHRKYVRLAQEKAKRLARHADHILSWQSRNKDKNQWGGAVRTPHCIFSFSGLTEMADEALMIMVAQRMREISTVKGQAASMASISGNKIWPLIEHWNPHV